MRLPFKIKFENSELKQEFAEKMELEVCESFNIFKTSVGGLDIHIVKMSDERYKMRIINYGEGEVKGRVMIVLPWQEPQMGYSLLPGAYYNGNYSEPLHRFPVLKMPESPVFRISLAACSTPAFFFWDGKNTGLHYEFSPYSKAGWNGIILNGNNRTVTFCIPAHDDDVSIAYNTSVKKREAYTWRKGDTVCAELSVKKSELGSITELYEYLWNEGRNVRRHTAYNSIRPDAGDVVDAVRNWVINKHFFITDDGYPILKNAFADISRKATLEEFTEWNIMIGWCSGTMTALPLLAYEGNAREIALSYIDFITSDGFAPSGVKLPIFDGKKWIDPRAEFNAPVNFDYTHCRFYCDYLYYLGKAIEYETSKKITHKNWEKVFKNGIDILTDLWQREKDFGRTWNIMTDTVTVNNGGTGGGTFALLALSQALKLYPDNEMVKKVLNEANEVYFIRCVESGRCGGGPNDALEADDSESIAALSTAYVQQYLICKDEKILDYALKASRLFASWVYSYPVTFPGGTEFEGINVCGGVIANVQNRHIGPGICTNSARFLYDLGTVTGDGRWIDLYEQIISTALNCVCMEDGGFFGFNFNEPFLKGMVSEQINIYDVYSESGFTWKVSASWPATNILLTDFESPYKQ